jgi:F-type H+-transporting ATPase subunit c
VNLEMLYFSLLVVAIGFGLALAASSCAFAQSKAIVSAMEGISRQPESGSTIQTSMIIGLAFMEALTIYALVISFMLLGKLPATEAVLEVLKLAVK